MPEFRCQMSEPRCASRPMRATRLTSHDPLSILPPSDKSFLSRCRGLSLSLLCFSEVTMDRVSGLPAPPRSEPILPPSSQELPSSPPSVASEAGGGRRPRKPPTVTPRSFRRFFTPRSLLNSGNNGSSAKTSRQALRTLNSPAVNRLGPAFTRASKAGSARDPVDGVPEDFIRTPSRKRKHSFSSAASPLQSSPLKKVRVRSPVGDEAGQTTIIRDIDLTGRGRIGEPTPPSPPKRRAVSPVSRSRTLQTSGSLFMRTVQGPRASRLTIRSTAGAGWSCWSYTNELNSNAMQAGKTSRLISIPDRKTVTHALAMARKASLRFHSAMRHATVSIRMAASIAKILSDIPKPIRWSL